MRDDIHRQEHDHEPQHGLPEALPAGERVLWQGSPDARLLARHAFHLRGLAAYFGVLIAWRGLSGWHDGESLGAVLAAMAWPLPLAAAALGFVLLLARWVAQGSVYTITDRRLVMRVGIVLTITFNLPLARIEAASLRTLGRPGPDGRQAGDLSLLLAPGDQIAYWHLWPHVRPWHLRRTEPMLRALPDAAAVSELLVRALARTLKDGEQARTADAATSPAPAPAGRPATDGLPHAA